MTSIAVIGSGNIGSTIGEAWRRAGHEVVYASRSPQRRGRWRSPTRSRAPKSVLLATPGAAVPELLASTATALDGGW